MEEDVLSVSLDGGELLLIDIIQSCYDKNDFSIFKEKKVGKEDDYFLHELYKRRMFDSIKNYVAKIDINLLFDINVKKQSILHLLANEKENIKISNAILDKILCRSFKFYKNSIPDDICNQYDVNGYTPFHYSIINNNKEALESFHLFNIDILKNTSSGKKPYELSDDPEILKYYQEYCNVSFSSSESSSSSEELVSDKEDTENIFQRELSNTCQDRSAIIRSESSPILDCGDINIELKDQVQSELENDYILALQIQIEEQEEEANRRRKQEAEDLSVAVLMQEEIDREARPMTDSEIRQTLVNEKNVYDPNQLLKELVLPGSYMLKQEDILLKLDYEIKNLSKEFGIDVDVAEEIVARSKDNVREFAKEFLLNMSDFKPIVYEKKPEICPILLDSDDLITACICGHYACKGCWRSYIESKVDEGFSSIKCMYGECEFHISMKNFCSITPELLNKYNKFRVENYLRRNKMVQSCNEANCDCYVQVDTNVAENNSRCIPILCENNHGRCLNCQQEIHSPCTCNEWRNWNQLINRKVEVGDEENKVWIAQNAKSCPRCQSNIEKNQGCNHMTCKKCQYQFCWLCLQPWTAHDTSKCNMYERDYNERRRVIVTETQQTVEATNRLRNYTYRFNSFNQSLTLESDFFESQLKLFESSGKIGSITEEDECRLLLRAIQWLTIVRRILRNSYAYGYFLKPTENQRLIFENQLEILQSNIETLSECFGKKFDSSRLLDSIDLVIKARIRVDEFIISIYNGICPNE